MAIRVLLVDDEPDMRMLVRLTLDRTEDIEVVGEAASGNEAIELVTSLGPDVVLLDQMMPGGLTGLETVERLRSSGEDVPIIVLFTAWATAELREQAAGAGIQGFLSKDEFTEVATTIRHVATAT